MGNPRDSGPALIRGDVVMPLNGPAVGPCLVICPECGAEIGRELIHAGARLFVLPLPKTCPECDALLGPRTHPAVPPEKQTQLPGVA